jgi:hypothetical protein
MNTGLTMSALERGHLHSAWMDRRHKPGDDVEIGGTIPRYEELL